MNWTSVGILIWLGCGVAFAGLGAVNLLPAAWSTPIALSGIFAYVVERSLRDQRAQTTVAALVTRTKDLSEIIERHFSDATAKIIHNIAEPKYWAEIESHFWVYNGLWTLPADEFNEIFLYSIRKRGVRWRAIAFAGETAAEKATAERRYQRMRSCALLWSKALPDLDKVFEVRVVTKTHIPGSTFMLTQRTGKPLIRLYVEALNRSETPRMSLEIQEASVAAMFREQFDNAWDAGQMASLSAILSCSTLEQLVATLPSQA